MPVSYTIQQGDSVISLSESYGLFADTIWNDAANSDLRQLRPDMNVLMPGDVVVIPDKRPRMEKRAAGAKYSFRRKGIPALFRLQVYDMHLPRANQSYTLTVDGVQYTGTSDSQGIVEQFVPALSKTGELVIGEDNFRIPLLFGDLDPSSELTGIQKRLNNMGYDCGDAGGELNEQTQSALTRFQREHGLPEGGEADSATIQLIEKIHDDPYAYAGDSGGGA
jgi:Putative peptidoglycan binding domain/LysM domain